MKFVIIYFVLLAFLYFYPMKNMDTNQYIKDKIVVYVQGEVTEAKSIELDKYSTLEDVLEIIELTNEADVSSLNPLMVLKDQDVIVIPKITQLSKVSINYASMEELMTIPGIGESKATKIIEYRNMYGLFQTLDDLMKIDGIKQKTFDKLKEYICL